MNRPYSSYKDSGIEWIGEIPSDWEIKPLKYCFSFQVGWTPPTGESENFIGDNKWATIADLRQKTIYETEKNISNDAVSRSRIKINPGGTLFYSFKLSVGKVAFAGCEMYTNEAIFSILPNNRDVLGYYYYLLPVVLSAYGRENIYGANLLNQELIKNASIIFPTKSVQEVIAGYLDCKTAQIDDLIAKKEQMIEFLKEGRTAIINQAVTRGLDSKVEMKDSGIEWLRNIPKHWEIKKLKFNASVQFSNVNKKSEEGELAVRLCNYVDVYYNDFITSDLDFMEATASPKEVKKFQLRVGDVIVTKDSEEWNDIAVPAYVASELPNVICGYHLAQIRPDTQVINGKYLFWLLSANCINYQFQIEASGVTRFGLGNYALSNSMVLIPPKKEQDKITDFLDRKTAQIDGQVEREKKSIGLLKEFRTALISEVVTGKIDVRN